MWTRGWRGEWRQRRQCEGLDQPAAYTRGKESEKWNKVKSLSRVQLFETPWTVAYHAPPSMGFFQARVLEWVAISFSRGSSQPRDWTWVTRIVGRRFTVWVTKEAQRKGKCSPKQDSHPESEGQEGNYSHTAEIGCRGQGGSEHKGKGRGQPFPVLELERWALWGQGQVWGRGVCLASGTCIWIQIVHRLLGCKVEPENLRRCPEEGNMKAVVRGIDEVQG